MATHGLFAICYNISTNKPAIGGTLVGASRSFYKKPQENQEINPQYILCLGPHRHFAVHPSGLLYGAPVSLSSKKSADGGDGGGERGAAGSGRVAAAGRTDGRDWES
jgi:hypothetical protein